MPAIIVCYTKKEGWLLNGIRRTVTRATSVGFFVNDNKLHVLDRHVIHIDGFEPTTRRQRQAMIMSRLHGVISNLKCRPTRRLRTMLYVTVLIHLILTSTRSSTHLPEDENIQKLNLV